jgi:pimeloyl-ACP methyl ester carboxylesterase
VDKSYQITEAADGRTLAFAEWGDPSGFPVFALHGTPGCRLDRHPDAGLVLSTGVRLIGYDRPGYGGSDRHRGRTVADAAADVAAIADRLGIGRFSVYGASGGGPHALAVAALLGHRVIRAACIVGVAPFDALGDEFFTGMDPENVREWGWASDPATALGGFDLAEADRKALGRADMAAIMREAAVEQTRNGIWGWGDDALAFVSPWGFDPAAIAVPTLVWYGTKDVLTPPSHGEWIARTVPGAEVRLSDLGHLGDLDADLIERHAWLTGRRPAEG